MYDAEKDSVWRFSDPSFFPNPDFSAMQIDNEQFSLMDGIIGLALSPQLGRLYYQSVATDRLETSYTIQINTRCLNYLLVVDFFIIRATHHLR